MTNCYCGSERIAHLLEQASLCKPAAQHRADKATGETVSGTSYLQTRLFVLETQCSVYIKGNQIREEEEEEEEEEE